MNNPTTYYFTSLMNIIYAEILGENSPSLLFAQLVKIKPLINLYLWIEKMMMGYYIQL